MAPFKYSHGVQFIFLVEALDFSICAIIFFRYKAAIGQKTGIVPSNYIEVISEPAETVSKPTAQVQAKPMSPLVKDAPSKTSYPAIVPTSPREEPDGERVEINLIGHMPIP